MTQSHRILSTAAICGVLCLFSGPTRCAEDEQPNAALTAKRQQAEQLAKDGKVKEAEAAFHKVVAEAQTALGADHAFTLHSRMLFFRLIGDEGRFQESVEGLREVLAAQKRELGPEKEDTLKTLDSLSVILRMAGRSKEAEATAAEVELGWRVRVKTLTQQLGPEHPETLKSRNNLALALFGQGKQAEAELENRAVIKIREHVLGSAHPDTLASRSNLAGALSGQGKHAEAEAEFRSVLTIRERVQGPEHPDTLASRNNLAAALLGQGKHAEAELRALLKTQELVLGLEHPDTLMSRGNLAEELRRQGKHAEAETENRAVLKIREHVLGSEHPDTLASRNNLAGVLSGQGKHAEAEAEFRAVLKLREHVLSPEHPDTLMSRSNLANSLSNQGKYAEAEVELRTLLKIQERALVPGHPVSQLIFANLALALAGQQKHEEAAAALQPVAQSGTADHQFQLAVMMAQGENFKKDPVEAYKWAALAAEQGHAQAKQSLETLESVLTPAQLAEVKKRLQSAVAVIKPPPSVPTLSTPAANAVLPNGVPGGTVMKVWDFQWQPVAGASAYEILVQRRGAPLPVVSVNTAQTSYRHEDSGWIGDPSLKDWTWKVRAEVQGQWQPWSEERVFSVAPVKPGAAMPKTTGSGVKKQPDATLLAMYQLAVQLERGGKAQEAVNACQKVVTEAQKTLGAEHDFTLSSRMHYCRFLVSAGRHAEAETELQRLVEVMERVMGSEHPLTLGVRNSLATTLYRQGRHAGAEAEYRAMLKVQERVLGPAHAGTLYTRGQLAFELGLQGKHAEAEAENRTLLTIHERQSGPAGQSSQDARIALAIALAGQQKHAEVEAVLQPLAKIGSALNQYNLAVMMTQGTRLKKDPVEAYKWAVLAAAQGHAEVKQQIKILESLLTPEQLAEGKKRATESKTKSVRP